MKIEVIATDQLSDAQKESIKQLRATVYPAAIVTTMIGKQFVHAPPQWNLLVWDEGELVSRLGLLTREIISNGETKMIGGIGGVLTHPESQSQGHASEAMQEAARLFDEEFKVAYALLFCGSRLVEFYKRLNWKPFKGVIYVDNLRGRTEFSGNKVMVLDVKEPAPVSGSLDLKGYTW